MKLDNFVNIDDDVTTVTATAAKPPPKPKTRKISGKSKKNQNSNQNEYSSKASKKNEQHKTSFSYLNLLKNDNSKSFPHRTQTLSGESSSRRNSMTFASGLNGTTDSPTSGSMEYLNQTKKSNYMARYIWITDCTLCR